MMAARAGQVLKRAAVTLLIGDGGHGHDDTMAGVALLRAAKRRRLQAGRRQQEDEDAEDVLTTAVVGQAAAAALTVNRPVGYQPRDATRKRRCWGFVDGTFRRMCRPDVRQDLLYNGNYGGQGFKYLIVSSACGLVEYLYGPIAGRHQPPRDGPYQLVQRGRLPRRDGGVVGRLLHARLVLFLLQRQELRHGVLGLLLRGQLLLVKNPPQKTSMSNPEGYYSSLPTKPCVGRRRPLRLPSRRTLRLGRPKLQAPYYVY